LAGVLMATAAVALAETYMPIDVPGAIATDASGINASGAIVGTYNDASNVAHGFRFEHGMFVTIDYPGALSTAPISINSRGDVTGLFLDSTDHWHGFMLSDGTYFVHDYPGATTGTFTLESAPTECWSESSNSVRRSASSGSHGLCATGNTGN